MNVMKYDLHCAICETNKGLLTKYIQISYYINVVIFLLFLHQTILPNVWIFWGCISIFVFTLLVQIIYTPDNTTHILVQLILLRYLLQMIFVIPVEGLFGYDSMAYLKSADLFSQYGSNIPINEDPFGIANSINSWPGLSIFSLICSNISNIKLFFIAKYIPSIISSLGISFIFLISRKISKSNQIALFSTFTSLSTVQYLEFHSWFVRESLAFIFLMIAVYLIVSKAIFKPTVENSILYLLILGSTIITHHFISLVLFIYVFIMFLFSCLCGKKIHKKVSSKTLLLITIVPILSYWIYVGIMPFVLSANFLKDILNQSLSSHFSNDLGGTYYTISWSLRRFIIKNGSLSFVILFGLICVCSSILKPNKNKIIFMGYIFGLFCIFIFSFIFPNYVFIIPQRIYMYAWPFVFIVAFDIFHIINIKYKYALYIIGLLFIIFNIWSIAPYIYLDNHHPEYDFGQVDFKQSSMDYSSINWIDRSYNLQSNDKIIGSSTAFDLIRPMLKVSVLSDPKLLKEGEITTQFKMLYFNREMFEIVRGDKDNLSYRVSYDTYKSFNNNKKLIKNYNNHKIEIYSMSSS